MDWNLVEYRRAAGFPQDMLRYAWVYRIITELAENAPMTAAEMQHHITVINAHDQILIGDRELTQYTAQTTLTKLVDVGLVQLADDTPHGAHTYTLVPLITDMLRHLGPIASWGLTEWDHLVPLTRLHRGTPPDAPIPAPDPADPYCYQTALDMTVEVCHSGSRWHFPVLVYCHSAGQPISPAGIRARSLAGISRDLAKRQMSKQAATDTAADLERVGLLARSLRRRRAVRDEVLYEPTPRAERLLQAWWQVAEWALPHDQALYDLTILRAGQLAK